MWLSACPEGATSQLPDGAVVLAVRWRLGLEVPAGMVAGRCVCGHKGPDRWGRHAGSCKWGGGRQCHHNYISACLRLVLAEAGAQARPGEVLLSELGVYGTGAKSKLDVGADGFPHERTELYDVRISDPTQAKYIKAKSGACAKGSEDNKERKYGAACRHAGHVFRSFVAELYGRLGAKARPGSN